MTEIKEPPNSTDEPVAQAAAAGYGPATLKALRRAAVFTLGTSVVGVGTVMIVAPGPAIVVIPLGLGILATEFVWAQRILDNAKERIAAGEKLVPDYRALRWIRTLLPKQTPQTATPEQHLPE
jgi:Putative transmembrane protein (PGPGW)